MKHKPVSGDPLTIYGLMADLLLGPTLSLHVSGIPLPIYGHFYDLLLFFLMQSGLVICSSARERVAVES